MKIAIDVSPLKSSEKKAHSVRGVGSYVLQLSSSLQANFPQHQYLPFSSSSEIPSDVDLIHFTYFDPFFINLPLIKKKKYVVTVHDMIPLLFPNDFPVGKMGRLRWKLQKKLLQRADHIITVSKSSREDIIKITNLAIDKVSVVYNGVSEIFGQSTDKKKLELVKNKYKLPERFALY